MSINDLLLDFTEMSKDIFGGNLTGVYLHGSFSLGCFNPKKSDLDILLVVEDDISDEQKIAFMRNVVKMNEDAPAKGIELSILKREFISEAKVDILADPMYVTLTLCRVLGYLKDNLILSKQTGGEWGIKNLPQEFHELIKEALICYQTDRKMVAVSNVANEYAEYMISEIEKCKVMLEA